MNASHLVGAISGLKTIFVKQHKTSVIFQDDTLKPIYYVYDVLVINISLMVSIS